MPPTRIRFQQIFPQLCFVPSIQRTCQNNETQNFLKSGAEAKKSELHKMRCGSSAEVAGVRADFCRTLLPPSGQVMIRRPDRCLHTPLLCDLSDSAEAPSQPDLR